MTTIHESPRIGSLCTGYAGLDLAVLAVFGGGRIVWVAENETGMVNLLNTRIPETPNLGDITEIDWNTVPGIDILTAGFPCQDISSAGKRAGIKEGNRSGLFYRIMDAVRVLRPTIVVLENVAALRWKDGGLGLVLGHLAEAGYDTHWTSIRASDIGAPHRRERVFLLAHTPDLRWDEKWIPARAPEDAEPSGGSLRRGDDPPDATGPRPPQPLAAGPSRARQAAQQPVGQSRPPDAETHERGRRPHGTRPDRARSEEPAGQPPRWGHPVPDADADADADREPGRPQPVLVPGSGRSPVPGHPGDTLAAHPDSVRGDERLAPGQGLQRPSRPDRHRDQPAADATGRRQPQEPSGDPAPALRPRPGTGHRHDLRHEAEGATSLGRGAALLDWGDYTPAIRRWELILGRPAPHPTEPGRTGRPRLSGRFVEWMMGLSDGFVTGEDLGLSRSAQLRALGNGVVPQQAATAIGIMLTRLQPGGHVADDIDRAA